MIELTKTQRRFLASEASKLKPVVMLGKEGPSDSLVGALNEALTAHELVKLKFLDYKDQKREIADQLAQVADAALVRIIGNMAIFFRRAEAAEERRYTLPD